MVRDEILKILHEINMPQWKLADAVGISEPTLTRWLRYPLEGERLKRVQIALEKLKEGQA